MKNLPLWVITITCLVFLYGCATVKDKPAQAYVSEQVYMPLSCFQLRAKRDSVLAEYLSLGGSESELKKMGIATEALAKMRKQVNVRQTDGAVVSGNEASRREILLAEYAAIQRAMALKGCDSENKPVRLP